MTRFFLLLTLKFEIEMQKIWYMKRGNLENNDQIGIKFLLLLNHYSILFIISVCARKVLPIPLIILNEYGEKMQIKWVFYAFSIALFTCLFALESVECFFFDVRKFE